MQPHIKKLNDASLLLIFAFAPAGFGHLRVTDALYRGLWTIHRPILLGAQDKSISYIHRLMSVHSITRNIFEWLEQGQPENITTLMYRWYLRGNTKLIYQQLSTLLDQRLKPPSTILVVATHFGLAHQIAAIKERLIKERKIRIILAVQVTDDNPHHIWHVDGADIIFVPSVKTKKILEHYGQEMHFPQTRFEINPYPINPILNEILSDQQEEYRLHELQQERKTLIHMMVPISGAAVGTDFFTIMIDELHTLSPRFIFHVVTKSAPYTTKFITEMSNRSYVKLYTSAIDREVIENYTQTYRNNIIGLEVTKPSEQAFKALYQSHKRGGSILLFARAVGRQEYDNLDFLRRHNLIPTSFEEKKIWDMAERNFAVPQEFLKKTVRFRGISIPQDATKAAIFVMWCIKEKIFETMMKCRVYPRPDDPAAEELRSDGVELFWQKVAELI